MYVDPVLLYDYTCWANDRVVQGARTLRPEQLAAPIREGFLSTLGLLAHMLSAEQVWLARWKGESPARLLTDQDIPTLDDLEQRWSVVRAEMREYVLALGTAETVLTYRTTRGAEQQDVLWQMVTHVINHSTEHRSQAALYLAIQGIDLGNLDLIYYVRDMMAR